MLIFLAAALADISPCSHCEHSSINSGGSNIAFFRNEHMLLTLAIGICRWTDACKAGYTKTDTDSKAAAFSVAKIGNYGRACRLVDTESSETRYETPEDPDFKVVNGDVSKFRF